jgi:hypothetical protein
MRRVVKVEFDEDPLTGMYHRDVLILALAEGAPPGVSGTNGHDFVT